MAELTAPARVGVPLDMIGLPGHFLLSTRPQPHASSAASRERVFVDAFHGGSLLDIRQCESIVRSYGYAWSEAMAQPVPPNEVCVRMLRNLLNCHKQTGDMTRARLVEATIASSSRGKVPPLPYPSKDTGDPQDGAEAHRLLEGMSTTQQQQLLQMLMQQMALRQQQAQQG